MKSGIRKVCLWLVFGLMVCSTMSWGASSQRFIHSLSLRRHSDGNELVKSFTGWTLVKRYISESDSSGLADLRMFSGLKDDYFLGFRASDTVNSVYGHSPITDIIVRHCNNYCNDVFDSTYRNQVIRYAKLPVSDKSGTMVLEDFDGRSLAVGSNNSAGETFLYYTTTNYDGKGITDIKIANFHGSIPGYEKRSGNLHRFLSNATGRVFLYLKRDTIPHASYERYPVAYNGTFSGQSMWLFSSFGNIAESGVAEEYFALSGVAEEYFALKEGSDSLKWSRRVPPYIRDAGKYYGYAKLKSISPFYVDEVFGPYIAVISKANFKYYTWYFSNQLDSTPIFDGDTIHSNFLSGACKVKPTQYVIEEYNRQYSTNSIVVLSGNETLHFTAEIPESPNCLAATIQTTVSVRFSKVSFNTDGGTTINAIQGKTGSILTAPANPTKEGYAFAGWNPELPLTIPRGENTYKALWKKLYTITFDTDGGSNVESIVDSADASITVPKNPTKENYAFAGWDNEIPSTMPAQDMTIKALWTYDRFKVKLPVYMEVVSGDKASDGTYLHGANVVVQVKNGYSVWGPLTYDGVVIEPKNGTYTLTVAGHDSAVEALVLADYGSIKIALDRSLAIIDGNSRASADVPMAIEVDSVYLTRNFERHRSTTITLPFTVDVAYVTGGIFCKVVGISDQSVRLMFVSTVVEANKPYVYVPIMDKLTVSLPAGEKVSIKTEKTAVTFGNWSFKNTYSFSEWNENSPEMGRAYGFAAKEEVSDGVAGIFKKIGEGSTVDPMRAYLVYNESRANFAPAAPGMNRVPARALVLPDEIGVEIVNEENETTAIGKINTVTGKIRIDRWFDLNGKMLKGKPTNRGVYYHNGNKVIIK